MDGRPQFSLGYLMLEVFWIALAIGLTRHIALNWNVEGMFLDEQCVFAVAFITDFVVIPVALGGLIGKMRDGAVCALAILSATLVICLILSPLLIPAVQ